MKLLAIFPKMEIESKTIDSQRVIRNTIKEMLELLKENNVRVYSLLEDVQARSFINEYKLNSIGYITCYPKKYSYIIKDVNLSSDLDSFFYNNFSKTDSIADNFTNKHNPDPTLLRKDYNLYLQKLSDTIKKQYKDALYHYVKEPNINIINFRLNSTVDRLHDLCTIKEDGDGKLLIDVNLSTGEVNVYYGGVYIDTDYLKTILNLY